MDDARRPPVHDAIDQPEEQSGDDCSASPSSATPSPGTVAPSGRWARRVLEGDATNNSASSEAKRASDQAARALYQGDLDAAVHTGHHSGPTLVNLLPGEAPDLRSFAEQLVAIAEQLRATHHTLAGTLPSDLMISTHAIDPGGDALGLSRAGPAPAPDAQTDNGNGITENRPGGHGESANDAPTDRPSPDRPSPDRHSLFVEMARATYAKRRKRAAIFGDPDLFGEPGWDILLDLYIAEADGKPVSVSSACIGSAAPPTTGLRWLGVLAEQGLVDRQHDPQDQRRVLVHLTEKAMAAMDEYFAVSLALDLAGQTGREGQAG